MIITYDYCCNNSAIILVFVMFISYICVYRHRHCHRYVEYRRKAEKKNNSNASANNFNCSTQALTELIPNARTTDPSTHQQMPSYRSSSSHTHSQCHVNITRFWWLLWVLVLCHIQQFLMAYRLSELCMNWAFIIGDLWWMKRQLKTTENSVCSRPFDQNWTNKKEL